MEPSRAAGGRRFTRRSPLSSGRTAVSITVGYRAADDRWWLWWACAECGGVELPLADRRGPDEVTAICRRLAGRTCPECETRRRRAGVAVSGPCVWYDTRVGDWVLQPPGCRAILPLEIAGFDASEVTVYRAASDIVHSGDAFDARG